MEEQSKPIKLEDLGQKQLTELQLLNNKISARTNARLVGTAASGVITQANRGASNLVDRKIKEMAGGETNQQTLLKTMNELKETMKSSKEANKIESGKFSTEDFLKYIEVVGGEGSLSNCDTKKACRCKSVTKSDITSCAVKRNCTKRFTSSNKSCRTIESKSPAMRKRQSRNKRNISRNGNV